MAGNAVDIDELEKLLAAAPGDECLRCHAAFSLHDGDDPTPLCDHCAQAVLAADVPALLAELRALRIECDVKAERIAKLERTAQLAAQRRFPILSVNAPNCPRSVPWSLIEHHEEQARDNHQQSVSRLAERGGLSPCEFLAVAENRPWRRMPPEESTAQLNALVAKHNSTTSLVDTARVDIQATPERATNALEGLDSQPESPVTAEQETEP